MAAADQPQAPEGVFPAASFEEAWDVFKRRRDDLSALSKAFVEETRTAIVDVNGKRMVFEGLGYAHPGIKKFLSAVGAAFNPRHVADPPPSGRTAKEYRLSVRYPWAQDRVM